MIQNNSNTISRFSVASIPVFSPPFTESFRSNADSSEMQETSKAVKVTMVTPWKQECGNAEYAERLCVALNRFSTLTPIDLRNLGDDFELRSKSSLRTYFDELVKRINSVDSDIVHFQHEFCFFGRSIQRSNREFLKVLTQINKPIVVTLHTWLERSMSKSKFKLSAFLKRPWDFFQCAAQRRDLCKALGRCDSIVVHTHETYNLIVTALPKLRKKIRIVQIPIAPVEVTKQTTSIVKQRGDVWILLPGFVSPYKGHRHAVNALEKLPVNYKLVIAGGRHPKDRGAARYWTELLTEVEEKGLQSRVIFTGFLPTGSEQAEILKQADVFLLPYDEVGQSGSAVLADSLAYDRTVITSRARSMFAYRMSQDTVYSSISTDVVDSASLANVIKKSCEDDFANPENAIHRKAAMRRYSLDTIGEAYKQLYTEVRNDKR